MIYNKKLRNLSSTCAIDENLQTNDSVELRRQSKNYKNCIKNETNDVNYIKNYLTSYM